MTPRNTEQIFPVNAILQNFPDSCSSFRGDLRAGTGLPASIAALMLDAGEVKVKGVVAPEGCIDPEKFIAALIKRGARIHQTETIRSMLEV